MSRRRNKRRRSETEQLYTVTVRLRFRVPDANFPEKRPLRVVYRALTPEILQRPGLVPQLAAAVVEIDLTDEGRQLKPSVELFENLPLYVLSQISKRVFGDYFPSMTEAGDLSLWYRSKLLKESHAPDDLDIFEWALRFNKTPEEIRRMHPRDRAMLMVVQIAQADVARERAESADGSAWAG